MGVRLWEPFFLSLFDLAMLTNDFFVCFIQETVVFQICTFTGKYAMVIPPLRGDAHGTRSRDVPLLSQ